MQNLLVLALIVVMCTIVYLVILNIQTLRKLILLKSSNQKRNIDDERYHELNNKIQLIIVVASIFILIGGFLGYNSIESINSDIRNKISDYENIIKGYDTTLANYDTLIKELEYERETVFTSLLRTTNEIESTKTNLVDLQKEYRLNAKTYFIKSVEIDQEALKDNSKTVRVFYKELRKWNYKIPVRFEKVPFLAFMAQGEGTFSIKQITNDYFDYKFSGFMTAQELVDQLETGIDTIVIESPRESDARVFDLLIVEGVN